MASTIDPIIFWPYRAPALAVPSDGERVFAAIALAYFAKALLPAMSDFEIHGYSIEGSASGNPLDQIVGGAIYAITVWFLVRDRHAVHAALARPLLSAFIVLAIASILWSAVPGITLRRAGGLLGTALFGAYLACRFMPHEVLKMIAAAFAIVTGLSILVIVFVPSYGIADGWEMTGVFGHKNDLGRAMIFAVLATWSLIRDSDLRRPAWAIPAFLSALALLLLSRSAQAYVGLGTAVVLVIPLLVVCARFFRKVHVGLALTLIVTMLFVAVVVSTITEQLLELLGRDATLTDRTVIWELLVEFAQERPWLGRGYGAFWFSDVSLGFADRWAGLDHAHNGYMDLWLELGYAGVGAFVLLLLAASKTAWNAYLMHPTPALRFFPTFILIAALVNWVGRLIPAHNSIYWVILCYCAMMHLSVQRSQRQLGLYHWRRVPQSSAVATRRLPQGDNT